MNKSILKIILLIFHTTFVTGQTITIPDMIEKISCKDFGCFNNFITKKNFIFKNNEKENSNLVVYNYLSKEKFPTTDNPNILKEIAVSIQFKHNQCYNISLSTYESRYYETLINELKNLGFLATETDIVSSNDKVFTYKSKSYPNIFFGISILMPASISYEGQLKNTQTKYIITIHTYKL